MKETRYDSRMRKNKGSQKREDPWHPHRPGRSLFPEFCCLLLVIDSLFLKSLNDIMHDPVLVDIKIAFFSC
jgi:hypothetical protein